MNAPFGGRTLQLSMGALGTMIPITQSRAAEKFEVIQTLLTTKIYIEIRLADGTRSVLVPSGVYNFALIRLTELSLA